MKRAAAKSKAQKATSKPANKIAASPRVPGTRDARLALPKSLTKKGWDYSQYMNRNDAESDRRYFAKQWTTAAKKEIQLRAELATLRKKAGGTDGQISAIKSKIKGIDQAVAKANATGQALQKRANERLKAAGRRVKEADKRVSEANKRLKAVNDKSSATRTSIAQRKADFQKRFGMTYEESLTRRGSTRRRKP
jgi:chromosome segregation ATPase